MKVTIEITADTSPNDLVRLCRCINALGPTTEQTSIEPYDEGTAKATIIVASAAGLASGVEHPDALKNSSKTDIDQGVVVPPKDRKKGKGRASATPTYIVRGTDGQDHGYLDEELAVAFLVSEINSLGSEYRIIDLININADNGFLSLIRSENAAMINQVQTARGAAIRAAREAEGAAPATTGVGVPAPEPVTVLKTLAEPVEPEKELPLPPLAHKEDEPAVSGVEQEPEENPTDFLPAPEEAPDADFSAMFEETEAVAKPVPTREEIGAALHSLCDRVGVKVSVKAMREFGYNSIVEVIKAGKQAELLEYLNNYGK